MACLIFDAILQAMVMAMDEHTYGCEKTKYKPTSCSFFSSSFSSTAYTSRSSKVGNESKEK